MPIFENFLLSCGEEKAEAIKKRMRDYADDVFPLPFTHACKEVGDFAQKLLIPDFEVVIIFDKFSDFIIFIFPVLHYFSGMIRRS